MRANLSLEIKWSGWFNKNGKVFQTNHDLLLTKPPLAYSLTFWQRDISGIKNTQQLLFNKSLHTFQMISWRPPFITLGYVNVSFLITLFKLRSLGIISGADYDPIFFVIDSLFGKTAV